MAFIQIYSEMADSICVKPNKQKVTRLLENAGYKQGDAIELPKQEYDDPAMYARFVVGQFLGWNPHSLRAAFIFSRRFNQGTYKDYI